MNIIFFNILNFYGAYFATMNSESCYPDDNYLYEPFNSKYSLFSRNWFIIYFYVGSTIGIFTSCCAICIGRSNG